MDLNKLKDTVNNLAEIDPAYDDIFEDVAILVDDLSQMMNSKASEQFLLEKRDCRDVAKHLYRRIQNTTFKNK